MMKKYPQDTTTNPQNASPTKPIIRILDLFCGEGGASMGYYRAMSTLEPGFNVEIVGVDIRPKKRYPFTFIQLDALKLDYEFLLSFDFIHASPPCQAYSQLSHFSKVDIDKSVLPRTLLMLEAVGLPYVVENVPLAPIRADIQLTGSMFGLKVKRNRIFQTNLRSAAYPQKTSFRENSGIVTVAGNASTLEAASNAMEIDWMSKQGINQAIPPIYTQWIFEQLLSQIIRSGGNHGF